MADNLVCAIDIGTTSTKVAIFNSAGERLAYKALGYPTRYPQNGWAEQHPEDWWQATAACVREILRENAYPRIAAICAGGQAPSCVPVDADGKPLRPAILWLDRRSTDQVERVNRILGAEQAAEVNGNRVDSYFGGTKWLWYADHEPELFQKTWKILQANGYINYRLTGNVAIDPSQAGLCGPFFDLRGGRWSTEILTRLGIDPSILPEIIPSHQAIGVVTEGASKELGLPAGIPVLCGGGDFAFSCLGAGVHARGSAALMLGTSGNLLIPEPAGFDTRLFNTYHVTGRYLALGGVYAGGSVNWIADILRPSGSVNFQELDQSAEKIAAGSEGLVFLPYLTGERSPIWNPHARGVFFGLSARHTQAHLYRAVLEGVAFAFRRIYEITQNTGASISSIVATDGGARSLTWLKILASALQVPISSRKDSGDTLLGTAFLAAYGSNQVSGFETIDDWLAPLKTVEPDTVAASRLTENYQIFVELYERNADLFGRLAQASG